MSCTLRAGGVAFDVDAFCRLAIERADSLGLGLTISHYAISATE